uniref:ADP-ribosylation factor n=1 Tax=Macrostomum lignano TaxID=282301 RepID=A0A1I8IAY1_9PLAT
VAAAGCSSYRVPEPTQGIHETTLELRGGRRLTLVEVGGTTRLLPLWSRLLRIADAVVYVVDFADPDSWAEARDRLHGFLLIDRSFAESRVPVLLLAAKADAARHGRPAVSLVRELRLCRIRHHRWHLQSVSAARRRDDEPADKSLGRAVRLLLRLVDDNRHWKRRQQRLQAVRAAFSDRSGSGPGSDSGC